MGWQNITLIPQNHLVSLIYLQKGREVSWLSSVNHQTGTVFNHSSGYIVSNKVQQTSVLSESNVNAACD